MRRWFCIVLIASLVLGGCSVGAYKMPKKQYRQQVRTLGVLPLLVDGSSPGIYPDAQGLTALLRRANAGKQKALIDLLRSQGGYFDVRAVKGDPAALFNRLVSGHVPAGKGETLHRSYRFAPDVVRQLCDGAVVDGLLVVILYEGERVEKRWDCTHLHYLKTPYDGVRVTAAVVLPSGKVAWEFPGYAGEAFLALQYPDFEEARYNRTDSVRLKFITLAGLGRVLSQPAGGVFEHAALPAPYKNLFDQISSALTPGLLGGLKAF